MKINSKVMFSLALAFLILLNMVAIGQKLQGKFLKRAAPDSGGQFMTFNDGKFTDTICQHLTNAYGVGRYTLSGRKLTLRYTEFPNRDTSAYTLERKPIDSEAGKLTVNFFIAGEAVFGEVHTLDPKGKILKRHPTNAQGVLSLNIEDVKDVEAIQMIGAFFYPVILPKAQLLGKDTKIRVDFKDAEKYYIPPGTKKFEVLNRHKDSFVLKSESGEKLVFDRYEE